MKLSSITEKLCLRVINTRGHRRVITLAVAILLLLPSLMAQDGSVRPSVNEARAAWDRGNYELAYEHFNGLLLLYSRDPLYKYYTGACLVKMERDIPRAVTLLGSAINSSVNVKSVPDDAWFYYGRALQMDGNFAQASEALDRFARVAGRRVTEEYHVRSYIDQCSRGQGVLSPPAAATAVPGTNSGNTTTSAGNNATSANAGAIAATSAGNNATSANAGAIATTAAKPGTPSEMKRSQTAPSRSQLVEDGKVRADIRIPAEYDTVLAEALRLQHEADLVLKTAGDTVRSATLRARADSLFMSLEEHAGPPSEKVVPAEPEMRSQEQIVSLFEVRKSSAYSEKNPVPVDFAMPAGLVYTVQIAAFRNPVTPSLFRGLYPVFGGRRAGSDVIFYYTGLFRRLEDARQALPDARSAGFPDAFVIAFMDGTQVSMERAGLLEKEWASKPLPGKGTAINAGSETSAGPVAPTVRTLSFRAEVMRISKPVKPDVIEKMELLAGSRGMDMIKNSEGETVFLIGNFITFESADEYVSLLIRNGYSTARVAAYVGMQEIPVDSAKELLNRLQDD